MCVSASASDVLGSCWGVERSAGAGETGGVWFMFSGAICWTGRTMAGVLVAGVVVVVVTSMGMEERVGTAGLGMVVGAEVQGLSWKGFSLSIRSVFVPDTGRPRSFSSSFSSATYTETNVTK